MIAVITGLPGAGKSLKLARIVIDLLERNRKWFENPKNTEKKKRILYTNLKLSKEVMEEYKGYIQEWVDAAELVRTRDVDVIWDELATAMDATQWQNMSLELKRWLQQHRKFGIEIYGTSQDFAQVDKSFRRLVSDLIHISKLFGSRDKSNTTPNVKHIWGLCFIKTLDPQKYNEEKSKFENTGTLPKFMWISKRDIAVYDTTAEVKMGKYPPLRHITRECEFEACDHVKTLHV